MGNPRARYTLEFKLEAVRMVKGGQSLAAVAKILDIRPQTLHNWIKAEQQGRLGGAGSPAVSAEQMEIARLKAELARVNLFSGFRRGHIAAETREQIPADTRVIVRQVRRAHLAGIPFRLRHAYR